MFNAGFCDGNKDSSLRFVPLFVNVIRYASAVLNQILHRLAAIHPSLDLLIILNGYGLSIFNRILELLADTKRNMSSVNDFLAREMSAFGYAMVITKVDDACNANSRQYPNMLRE